MSVIVKNEQVTCELWLVLMRRKDYTDFTVVTPGAVITICVDYSTYCVCGGIQRTHLISHVM